MEEEPWVPRVMVAVLCQDPPSRSHLLGGSCSQLPLSWRSWGWGISRDEHALGGLGLGKCLGQRGQFHPWGLWLAEHFPCPHNPCCFLPLCTHKYLLSPPLCQALCQSLRIPILPTLERAWYRLAHPSQQPPPSPRAAPLAWAEDLLKGFSCLWICFL